MRFDGSFSVSASPEQVWPRLIDVKGLAGCVPGAENVRQTEPNRYAGAIKVRLGPMSTHFELTGTVEPRQPNMSVDVQGRERLTGTIVQARFDTAVAPAGDGSEVTWALDVTLRGRLGQMGQAVFQDVARRMTDQTVACLKQRIESGG